MASPLDPFESVDAGSSHGGALLAAERVSGRVPRPAETGPAPQARRFGEVPEDGTVELWTLVGRGGLALEVMTLGGIVTRLLAPGRNGKLDDVVLGFNELEQYVAGHPYFGAITGRTAGRTSNAAFTLEGKRYELARNDPPHHLHGGERGLDKRIWKAAPVARADGAPSLRLTYRSPDGEEGYPGNVDIAVTYTVTDDNEFLVETEATSDKVTPLNLAHHSYFNLAGEGSGSVEDHWLEVFADEIVPVDEFLIATGRREPVTRGSNDFRQAQRLSDAIPLLFQQHGDLYALPTHGSEERVKAARLTDPRSGRAVTVSTTERYLQFYTGSHLHEGRPGKSGKAYGRFAGVCLECQGYPDMANEELRKEILLRPGQTQRHSTAYAFSVADT